MNKKIKVLNLYAGVGGNRKNWKNVEVTAVEKDPYIAEVYKQLYPEDTVIVEDAHQYLLEHFREFDFIWSSPPCPTHSVTNNFLHYQGNVRYPDMSLWQQIVFLQKGFREGKWVVENVKSYYPPLWPPKTIDRHYFWSNFDIEEINIERGFNIANARATTRQSADDDMKSLEEYHGITLPEGTKGKRLLLKNCVNPKVGEHILREAFKEETQQSLLMEMEKENEDRVH